MPLESKNVKVFNNCASNPLVELVIILMGGGASNGACFRHLTRCDEVGVNVFKTLFRVGLHPTHKTLNSPHPLREGARGWGLISSRRVSNCKIKKLNVGLHPTYSTICNDEIALPPQRGRLGGVQPVGSTSLTRHCEECEFTPEAIQNNNPLFWAREILLSRNNFPLSIFNSPLLMRENRRVRFNAPQPTTKEVFQC